MQHVSKESRNMEENIKEREKRTEEGKRERRRVNGHKRKTDKFQTVPSHFTSTITLIRIYNFSSSDEGRFSATIIILYLQKPRWFVFSRPHFAPTDFDAL
jgi:hypothetical protein